MFRFTKYKKCVIINMSRKLAYNKKEHSVCNTECLPKRHLSRHLSHRLKCHFFIANTNKVRSDKMIEMYLKNFIIKILFFILSPPIF